MAEEQQHTRTMQRLERLPVPAKGESCGNALPCQPAIILRLMRSCCWFSCVLGGVQPLCGVAGLQDFQSSSPGRSPEVKEARYSTCRARERRRSKEARASTAKSCSGTQTACDNLSAPLHAACLQGSHTPAARHLGLQ